MRHITILLTALALTLGLRAQNLYPSIPDFAWDIILDRAETLDGRMLSSRQGQYMGQVNYDHILSGFGYYIDTKDNQRIGLYRNGAFLFGITLTQTSALVGTPDDYACYSLTTTRLDYVKRSGETLRNVPCTTQFVSATYENGDRYIGEFRDGKRHGWGIYYYASGDFWFGQYREGLRDGYGCLFGHDYILFAGLWKGEKAMRQIAVRCQ